MNKNITKLYLNYSIDGGWQVASNWLLVDMSMTSTSIMTLCNTDSQVKLKTLKSYITNTWETELRYGEIHVLESNASWVTNEVRLQSLRLNKDDIADILELFNHAKSIWFLHCELDLQGETVFRDTYYQIQMLSIIEWKSFDHNELLTTNEMIDFLDSISWSRLRYNLRNINLRGDTINIKNKDIDAIEAKIGKVIIIQSSSMSDLNYKEELIQKQYEYWLSTISNMEKDDPIYQTHN